MRKPATRLKQHDLVADLPLDLLEALRSGKAKSGDRLRAVMLLKGIETKGFTRLMGEEAPSRQAVEKYIKTGRGLGDETLDRIGAVLEVSGGWLKGSWSYNIGPDSTLVDGSPVPPPVWLAKVLGTDNAAR